MKLSFYGADQCVTGSCHCLEVGGKHILIDCGLQQDVYKRQVLQRMIRVLREGRAQSVGEALNVMKKDLKALNASVQVEQEEYDEVVALSLIHI